MSKDYNFECIYDLIPECKDNRLKYKDAQIYQIYLPARVLVIGGSGSAKTQWVLNFLRRIKAFTRIWVFAKKLDEKLYKYLRGCMKKVMKARKDNTLYYESDDINKFPDFTDKKVSSVFDVDAQNCIIIDDMLTEKQKHLIEAYLMGRKFGITLIYISQSYFQVPKLIRRNVDYLVIKKQNQDNDLKKIYEEMSSSIPMTFDRFFDVYRNVKQNINNGLMIDTLHPDQNYHVRVNLTPLSQTDYNIFQDEDEDT